MLQNLQERLERKKVILCFMCFVLTLDESYQHILLKILNQVCVRPQLSAHCGCLSKVLTAITALSSFWWYLYLMVDIIAMLSI